MGDAVTQLQQQIHSPMDILQEFTFLSPAGKVWKGDRDSLDPEDTGVDRFAKLTPEIEVRGSDDIRKRWDCLLEPFLCLVEFVSNFGVIVPQSGVPVPSWTKFVGEGVADIIAETYLALGECNGQSRTDFLVPVIEMKRVCRVVSGSVQVFGEPVAAQNLDNAVGVPGK